MPPRPAGSSPRDPSRRPDAPPDVSDWFPVYISGATDDSEDGKPQYLGYEVYNRAGGNTIEAEGRRVLTAEQPGVPVGDATFAEGDYAQARLCPGDGGRSWELMAGGGTGGGEDTAGCGASLAALGEADCLRVETEDGGEFGAEWDDAAGGFVFDEPVSTDVGDAVAVLVEDEYGRPLIRLTVEGYDPWYLHPTGACANSKAVFAGRRAPRGAAVGSGSGGGAGGCADPLRVGVGCDADSCYVRVCDDSEYLMPRRLCFTGVGEWVNTHYAGDMTFTFNAPVELRYRAPPPGIPVTGIGTGHGYAASDPDTDQWWFGVGEYTVISDPGRPYNEGQTFTANVWVTRARPDGPTCNQFLVWVQTGSAVAAVPWSGGAQFPLPDMTGSGPPNPLPWSSGPFDVASVGDSGPGFLRGEAVISDGLAGCAEGSGGGDDDACCSDALAAHPDLAVHVPDGPYAGDYTFPYIAGAWTATIAGETVAIHCAVPGEACDPDGGLYLNGGVLGGANCTSSLSCSPFGAVWGGALLGGTGDITAEIAP